MCRMSNFLSILSNTVKLYYGFHGSSEDSCSQCKTFYSHIVSVAMCTFDAKFSRLTTTTAHNYQGPPE